MTKPIDWILKGKLNVQNKSLQTNRWFDKAIGAFPRTKLFMKHRKAIFSVKHYFNLMNIIKHVREAK